MHIFLLINSAKPDRVGFYDFHNFNVISITSENKFIFSFDFLPCGQSLFIHLLLFYYVIQLLCQTRVFIFISFGSKTCLIIVVIINNNM